MAEPHGPETYRQATAEGLLMDWFAFLRQRNRHVWAGPERAHVQVRSPDPGSDVEELFAEAVRSLFERQEDVNWARYNAEARRVVIDGPAAASDPQRLVRRLEELEARLGLLDQELGVPGGPCGEHPADLEPILRGLVDLAAQLVGGGVGVALRGTGVGERLGIDLAAVLRSVESVPGLREAIERVLGSGVADLILSLADGVDHALLRGLAGPLVALLEHSLQLRARLRQRRQWEEIEAQLSAEPGDHPECSPEIGERPCPLREGAIEIYAEKAGMLALGAFGFGLASSGDLEGSAGAVLASLPRPAVLGRSAFTLELSHRLAESGALLLDPEALERLDRIDCLVIESALLDAVWGQALLTAAREAGLMRVVVAEAEERLPGDADRRCPPGEAATAAVRALQAEGRGVMVFAGPHLQALAAADLGVGFRQEQGPPPWGAHVIAGPDLTAAWLLLPACRTARRCARQSVQASLIEVVVGLALCLDGVDRRTTLGVNQATHLLAVIAIANGVRLARSIEAHPPEPAADTTPWHAMEVEEVLERLGVDHRGRDGTVEESEGDSAQERRGPPGSDLMRLVLEELDSPLVPVLTAGAALSALVASPVDAGLILAVLAGNALMGAFQRQRVERAVAALQCRHAAPVWVRHGGELRRIDAAGLRVGDVIGLEAGEVVPADCRILSSTGLQVDEAVLTGESFPVAKDPHATAALALAERRSMLYAGTTVVAGEVEAVVIAVGDATEARRGLAAVRDAALAGGVEGRLESLTEITTPIATMSGLAVLLSALARGRDPRGALGEGVALAVAAVPEGLPVLASLAQFAAAERLSGEKVLVRNPRAIESLGRVDVICLDKTGTLTSGHIRLVEVSDGIRSMAPEQLDAAGTLVLRLALWATPVPEPGKRLAHPTDRGLLEGAEKAGLIRAECPAEASLPFEPSRGYHASLCRQDGRRLLCVKGSPEIVLAASVQERTAIGPVLMDGAARERLMGVARDLAKRGLRVLAVASRSPDEAGALSDSCCGQLADVDVRDLEFVGFVALEDPIRETAREALADLRRAGVAAKIITGDHPATAAAIARELDLPTDGSVLTGPMLEDMNDAELQEAVLSASVFARITSMQKMQIVRTLRQAGRVVAMTGDGANDAAAIRLADVGIALGSRATEAARSAADIVVTDGRIETIVRAVLEGRALWRSVRDAVGLLVGGNLGEIGFTLFTGLGEGRPALTTRQLLLLNLLTDVAPALAIALRPPADLKPEDLLEEGPEASLGKALDQDILRTATITALSAGIARSVAGMAGDRQAANTVGLLALVGTQLGQAMATRRTDGLNLLTGMGSFGALLATVQTPVLSQAFGCRPLGPLGLLQAGTATAVGTGVGVVLPWLQSWLTPPRAVPGSTPRSARGGSSPSARTAAEAVTPPETAPSGSRSPGSERPG
ncbi:cation-transporting P-type ATPase [Synechococcus sp. Cruz-9H2]|uniref:cation-translocating P-type ATPase n=1 Tax=unclassified Synechococcus TaxID=2626047 RepID=UPI0020CD2883|nr:MULTISPECIES: cation-transporting P-type ATPase [unclassified Synechococcus]MCP9820714.1 cation-transporting P-type ATPase [Synechococcus sp. Cruz-9H2]MCP9844900.1 cation-transporting P-type ATPase [Synechococcus sp. Edmonson 11F2]MCP9857021.1 cation-transporting P-type ATPase [Synechococcus sp. Cruz-9C9]MCP9864355.1 cation-transporting P-type ATPase [Synechococcus sp. Cruz-7E5]MCP9871624.1 cation-transporting P-type ATPase [Synechococcus sp. Cruz-7B9]